MRHEVSEHYKPDGSGKNRYTSQTQAFIAIQMLKDVYGDDRLCFECRVCGCYHLMEKRQ